MHDRDTGISWHIGLLRARTPEEVRLITQAVILAGGKGTRLGTLVQDIPKPALDIGGRPFIQYLMRKLSDSGVTDIVVSTGHLADVMEAALVVDPASVRVRTVQEPSSFGTGGGLRNCANLLRDAFFVLNGDSLFDCDYQDLAGLLRDDVDVAIALRAVDDVGRYGEVRLAGARVLSFNEKGGSGPGLINGGVYAMTSNVFARIPEGVSSLEMDLFPALTNAGRLAGRRYDGFFIDIGTPASLEEARRLLPVRSERNTE